MKKVIIVANVAKEHILKFHVPTIKMLKENGWHVDVACGGNEEIPYCDRQFHMKYGRNPFSFRTIEAVFRLRYILKKGNYDVLHCHTATGSVAARLAVLGMEKKPYIMYTAHGFHFYKKGPILSWILLFPIEWMLSFVVDRLIVINQEDYQVAVKSHMGMKEISMLHGMGIDKGKFTAIVDDEKSKKLRDELKIAEDEIVFTYVAEVLKNKNQEVLIHAIKRFRQRTGKGILLLVGPIHDNGMYQQLAKEIGADDFVKFLGWRDDVREIFSITDIYVASSLREGLGLNLVEAQYAGLPVIASNNRGHKEIIEDGQNGFLVPAKDVSAYIKKMLALTENQEIYNRFVENGRKTAEKFSLESSLNTIISFYQSVERENNE